MKKSKWRTEYKLGKSDYVIVCGDFGLLWTESEEFRYNLDWMSRLPFTILWVQGKKFLIVGNHDGRLLGDSVVMSYFEGVDKMYHVNEYIHICHFPLGEWNGMYRGAYTAKACHGAGRGADFTKGNSKGSRNLWA